MPTWDELFRSGVTFEGIAPEVARLATLIRAGFRLDPSDARVWDVGCGTGRHTVFFARLGFDAYASDDSPAALERLREALAAEGVAAASALADMEEAPFGGTLFHAIVIWNVIQHARSDKIARVLANLRDRLVPGGYLALCVKSSKAEEAGRGEEVEPGTWVMAHGMEAGVPHHYFTREEIERGLSPLGLVHLVEVQETIFADATGRPHPTEKFPYRNAHWVAIGRKAED
jgi:SAM-dependent methyltransferase